MGLVPGGGRPRRRALRATAVVGLAVTALAAWATPTSAHPGFSAASGNGFLPNTAGGTGAPGFTSPYQAGASQTLFLRVPYEQGDQKYQGPNGTGGYDTTIRVDAVVPDGWTGPACGNGGLPKTNDNTSGTNQPGSNVSGWSCTVVNENGHDIVRWTGPQVASDVTTPSNNSAIWFLLTVTTPTPEVQTTYNGADGSGTEGFIVDQWYASSQAAQATGAETTETADCTPNPCSESIRHWVPNADYVGTIPDGADFELPRDIATNLVRTVQGTSGTVSISTSAGSISGADRVAWSPVLADSNPPAGVSFPYGKVTFRITGLTSGQTVTVTLTYPGTVDAYWKYQSGAWSEFAGAAINGNVVTLTLVDGGAGDSDGVANGEITDPGGPSVTDTSGGGSGGAANPVVLEPTFTG